MTTHLRLMSSKPRRRWRSTSGMTLVEMLIVIALIAFIASLAIGGLGVIFGSSQEQVAKQFVTTSLEAPLTQYRMHVGNYPTTAEGIQALIKAPSGKEARWKGPYLSKGSVPLDPWGNPYQYRYPGQKNALGARGYDLWSQGPDSASEADDIGNWE